MAVKKLLTTDLSLDEVCKTSASPEKDKNKTLFEESEIHAKTVKLCGTYKGVKMF